MKKLLTILMLLTLIGGMNFAQAQKAGEKKSDLTAKVPVDKKVKIGKLANGMTYVELSNEPGYMDEFVAACFVPHTDAQLFD